MHSEYANTTVTLKNIETVQFIDGEMSIIPDAPFDFSLPSESLIEGSGDYQIALSLNFQPQSNVTTFISFEGEAIQAKELTFTSSNWEDEQFVNFSIPDNSKTLGIEIYQLMALSPRTLT